MKKVQVIIISLLFFITNIQADFLFNSPNPYSFGPQGRSVSDLRNFATPKSMTRILPNIPVVATDSSGNRVYYTPDGKMTVSVAKDGSMSFSLGGTTKSYNASGELTGTTKTLQGTGLLQEVRNENGEIISYRALNGDGKIAATYDKDKNLTATYIYTGQGAMLDYVQNELTGGRTYYDEYGRTMKDVDFEGNILRTYQYEDISYLMSEDNEKELIVIKNDNNGTGLLVSTRDYTQTILNKENAVVNDETQSAFSTTYYNKEGKAMYVKDAFGTLSMEYHYKNDDKGNEILDYVLDNLTKNKTYYNANGDRDYIANDQGVVITRFYGSYSVNLTSEGNVSDVTKYDIDGKELYTTFGNIVYNDDGTISKVVDEQDNVLIEYVYTEDSDGKKILHYVKKYSDSEYDGIATYTWYDDQGRQTYTTSSLKNPDINSGGNGADEDNVLKIFYWTDNTLNAVTDKQTGTTKYYDMKKEVVYEAFNERLISKNIYDKGQLIGKWDVQKHEYTIYRNERAWISIKVDNEPSVAGIRSILANYEAVDAEKEQFFDGEKTLPTLENLLLKYGIITEGEAIKFKE